MNEARRADREIFGEILKWVAKGKGSVEAGLSHYTREFATEPLWKLLSQQPEGHPDQGKERRPSEAPIVHRLPQAPRAALPDPSRISEGAEAAVA